MILTMITPQHREEMMHRAHICAIASQAGVNLAFESINDYGADGHFAGITTLDDGSLVENGAKIDFQMKATIRAKATKKAVSFPLKTKDYNRMAKRASLGAPVMLILLALPENEPDWATFRDDDLVLRKCCYWIWFQDIMPSKNSSTVTVHFPFENILVPDVVRKHLEAIEKSNIERLDIYSKLFGG